MMECTYSKVIDQNTNPIGIFEYAIDEIKSKHDEYGVPVAGYIRTPSRLKRLGVTFLVKLIQYGKEELVPFRVENSRIIFTRFSSQEDLASWRGKFIHLIKIRSGQTFGEIIRKITACLKTAMHRFVRKIQAQAFRSKVRLSTELQRFTPNKEQFRRFDRCQMTQH